MPQVEVPPATQRFDGVDVLRGISIAAVVLHHFYLRMLFSGHALRSVMPAWLFRLLYVNGGNAVTVFFAVSGFLITYISLRRFGSISDLKPRIFYRIRFARIAPLLLALLVVLSVLHLLHVDGFSISPKRGTLLRALTAALTFHLNWFEAKHGYLPPNWDVLWSLSIEEMFYLFFPIACVMVRHVRRGGTALLCFLLAALVVLAPMGRTIWAATELEAEKSYLGGMGSIAMGCLTALLLRRLQTRGTLPSPRRLLVLAWGGAVVMFIAMPPFPLGHWHRFLGVTDLDDSLLTLGTCMVILGLVGRNRAGSRWAAPIRWLGQLSYEVYLTHEFIVIGIALLALHVGTLTGKGLGFGMFAWSLVTLFLSSAFGWVVATYFSEPMNRGLRGAPYPAELKAPLARR
ncbi:acyltransferase family protein [Terriglobus roseus]|uniref:Peptidoglycan/LPS O-acetylase OafA/YrhL, contains acyltransferase and SGNH-hydrolase domains n=1 Tax=Terriglobus roseus TaxID=392734 RepID=A0A1G7QNB1_9BACT|nr:acyltransferase [Terriglobus roseus]SDF99369.1 Peptidoglycan/LPS O-acetylase OafA/YrhL, contains acyltransferase and SGNH-hydrolase domains [Terriglobus roseus]